MYLCRNLIPLLTVLTLLGCSAERDDQVSMVSKRQQAAASLAPDQSTAVPPADHIARRPSSPAPSDDLPLWPPAHSSAPSLENQPLTSSDVPPFNTPLLPSSSDNDTPDDDTAQPSFAPPAFEPAPPASDPPQSGGPVLGDPNPLRGSEPSIASVPVPPPIAVPAPAPSGNPLRQYSPLVPTQPVPPWQNQVQTAPAPLGSGSSEPTTPGALLPHAPSDLEPPAQSFTSPKFTQKPPRLPRIPVTPQARAQFAPSESTPSSLNPSGGSAPPPRVMSLGTKTDPPTDSQPFSFSPEAPATSPTPPPPPLPIPATSAPVPSFPVPSDPAPSEAPATDPPAFVPPAVGEQPPAVVPSVEPPTAEPSTPMLPEAAVLAPSETQPPIAAPAITAITPPTVSNEPFDVVRVFYGTDRLPVLMNRDTLLDRLIRFLPAALLIGLSVVGLGVVLASRKISWIIGTVALMFFSAVAVWHGIGETVAIAELAAQEEPKYSAEKSDRGRIERGICEVSIPKSHEPGEMEGPSIFRFEREFDPNKHITLRRTIRLQDEAFYAELRAQVASSPNRELLVFVHGFNVKFEDAARRTAQMAHDMKFEGAPVFFSWPADEYFLLTYGKDETSVGWSAPHLKEFLLDLVHHTDAKAINLVAHSMGNRALATALREIDLQLHQEARLFNQVVLAAPDIDADDFRDNIVPAVQRTAKQVTLYASKNDIALGASRFFHRNARAGDTSRGLVIVPGMHTIDVSNIDGGPWGHAYLGASDPVLRDLHLLLTSLPPERRTWLKSTELNGQVYWAFKPLGTARGPAMLDPR